MAYNNLTPNSKRCTKCEKVKPFNAFHKKRQLKSGYRSCCKECRKESTKQYYENNKLRILKRNCQWRIDNIDRIRTYRIARNESHKEVIHDRWHRWYLKNKQHIRGYINDWRKNNPEKHKGQQIRRRARKLNASGEYSVEEFNHLCATFNNRCLACGKKTKLEADHVVPLSRGGSNDIANIQPLCRSCNSSKGIQSIDYRTP